MTSLRPTMHSSPAARASELVERTLAAPAFVDVVVPRTSVAGKMRLVTRAERFEATAEARKALEAAGFPVDVSAAAALGANEQWHNELGVRLLAIAVRDPANTDRALASLEEWRECDDDQLDAMWVRYQDLAAEFDPLGAGTLTEADAAAIASAAKKKDAGLLMSYGSRKLALYAISSAAPPASSETSPS